jgi:hypothetical protein
MRPWLSNPWLTSLYHTHNVKINMFRFYLFLTVNTHSCSFSLYEYAYFRCLYSSFRIVFWDVLPSSLMMEAVCTSETSVDNYLTLQYIPEDNSEHHTRRRENLKSHIFVVFLHVSSRSTQQTYIKSEHNNEPERNA